MLFFLKSAVYIHHCII